MSLSKLIEFCFAHGLDGSATDQCVKASAGNRLKAERPILPIDMTKPEDLLRMMKGADSSHLFVDGGVFHFNAMYAFTDEFPAARFYVVKVRDMFQAASLGAYLKEGGVAVSPVTHKQFLSLLGADGYAERYTQWHKHWEVKSKTFKGLLDGRSENTAVDNGIWLSSDGKCVVCGEKTDQMTTATLIGKFGVMVGFQLCQNHLDESKNHPTLLHYLANNSGIPAPFFAGAKVSIHDDEALSMSTDAVREQLQSEIEKIERNTITAVRKSGFRIILRQDALNNYAYQINDPVGKPVARIDSADHHEVQYGPDHVHADLSKKKKNLVGPSFTYGFVVADLRAIRQLVENAEERWGLAQQGRVAS